MSKLEESFKGMLTAVTFVNGSEHGVTRSVWATREIVVVIQEKRVPTLPSYPKPIKQIYALRERTSDASAIYQLVGHA